MILQFSLSLSRISYPQQESQDYSLSSGCHTRQLTACLLGCIRFLYWRICPGSAACSVGKHNTLCTPFTCHNSVQKTHPASWQSFLTTQVSHCSKKFKIGHLELWLRGRRKNKIASNSEIFLMSKEYFRMFITQKNDGRKQGGSFFLQQPFFSPI